MRILRSIVQAHMAEQVIVQCVLGLIVLHEAIDAVARRFSNLSPSTVR